MKIIINETWKKFSSGKIYECTFTAALAPVGLVFEVENVSSELTTRLKLTLAQFLAGHAEKEPLKEALKDLLTLADRESAVVKMLQVRADTAIEIRENL